MSTDASPAPQDVYTHGHHESVLRSHRWRTAENSAAYLLPLLSPGQSLLDVGCGPGTVTIDLAQRLAPGEVVGVDTSSAVIEIARAAAKDAQANVTFDVADAYRLPFPADSFDVVHAHQVLQHLTDPVAALREMRRVTKPGGIVAVRDADYSGMTWFPRSTGLDEWLALYHEVTQANGAEADAGRRLLSWVREAGFDPAGIAPSAGTWCYATPEDREWWAGLWADRSVASNFAAQAIEHGLADEVGLELLADAWREWGHQPDGWFTVLHGEVLARA
ncbi:methyltransferase domain-containing protein [Cellulomonas sp. PhB150]|uniref:methyltransferase domain-containing protein n=1 Tax=Cellulomonas sp. PhB150 TaxID=2485188 RepID=UPI000F466211|nr:methyltransferase domain-containing protein [Cellulomonas sp. PhB150]ROS27782.1 methyltransferase family protein [Cellulomonas sp. PhB150]